jgi:hypothetical protein
MLEKTGWRVRLPLASKDLGRRAERGRSSCEILESSGLRFAGDPSRVVSEALAPTITVRSRFDPGNVYLPLTLVYVRRTVIVRSYGWLEVRRLDCQRPGHLPI